MSHKHYLPRAIILAAFLLISTSLIAAPSPESWPYWQVSNEQNPAAISHQPFTDFLKTYIKPNQNGINLLAYSQVAPHDKKKLNGYIKQLEQIDIRKYNKTEQLAFWANLYNAKTVAIILEHYPVASIKEIHLSPIWQVWSRGPWDAKVLTVSGQALSLNDIEHRILRPIWHDPRVHYLINCASIGCPNLRTTAYQGKTIASLMTDNAMAFINHPRGVHVSANKLQLSSIYKWFISDFGGNEQGILRHLKHYAKPELSKQLQSISPDFSYQYDWSLNEAK